MIVRKKREKHFLLCKVILSARVEGTQTCIKVALVAIYVAFSRLSYKATLANIALLERWPFVSDKKKIYKVYSLKSWTYMRVTSDEGGHIKVDHCKAYTYS